MILAVTVRVLNSYKISYRHEVISAERMKGETYGFYINADRNTGSG
ncbi:MAG: hypothetical protein ACLVLH_11260 [Eisenbergiella massiliensis]